MLYDILISGLTRAQTIAVGTLFAFAVTFMTLGMRFSFLPQDHGREFAANGALSKGKIRGVGMVFVVDFILSAVLFLPLSAEFFIYLVLLFLVMLSGYLDDASKTPWSEWKKGLIDFALSVVTMVVFLSRNGRAVPFLTFEWELPYPVYFILGVALIWVAINVTNCSDGVDGLCASLTIVTILSFVVMFPGVLGSIGAAGILLAGVLFAYLHFNCPPSSMLMGDAGSRALGFFIAILSMKSGHPLAYLLLSLVLIIDGGLGLVKVSLIRFCKINVMKDIRTPIHDHMRTKHEWSDTQLVIRFVILQVMISALFAVL